MNVPRSPAPPGPRGRIGPVLSLFLLLAASPLAAQVNVEDLRPDDPPDGLSGSLGGDLTLQTGNTRFIRIGLQVRLNRVDEEVHTLIVGNGGLGFLASSRFASSGLAHYRKTYWRETHWLSEHVAPEWFVQSDYDRSRSLSFRGLVGAGIRTPTYRPDWGRVGGGTSLIVEHERYILPETSDARSRANQLRSSNFLTLSALFGDDAGVSSTTYVQPKLSDFGDVRVLHELTFSTGIAEDWRLNVSFDLRYDSRSLEHVRSLDTRLRTGATLRY